MQLMYNLFFFHKINTLYLKDEVKWRERTLPDWKNKKCGLQHKIQHNEILWIVWQRFLCESKWLDIHIRPKIYCKLKQRRVGSIKNILNFSKYSLVNL